MTDRTRPEFLLVHGAWHGGWCWAELQAALTERGFAARTVDLPSVGGIAELADDAAVVRAALAERPVPTVLVGHSYGGAVISEAGADAAHVRHLVYLCAFMLPAGMSVLDAVEHEVPAWIEVDMDTGMATVPDPRTAFYLDCAETAAAEATARLQPQCMGAFAAEQSAAAWQQLPSTYLICTEDNAIPASAQEAMSAGAHTVVRMDASHSPFMSQPGAVADVLIAAAGR
ncbi:MAG: alpha/beta hydrolase [Sporichthyaceae bacterium]